ncbi:MAG: hypothetical protein PVF69_02555 [Gemmatimonadota bacterium]
MLFAALFVVAPVPAFAQSTVTVRVEENFRRAPNDVVVARLNPGTPLSVVSTDGDWLEVDVEGWVWLSSLQVSESELDLVVSVAEGENLRSEPQGTVIGRLEEGALLDELGREPGWAHVRRRGWIWSASVSSPSTTAAAAPTSNAVEPASPAPAPAAPPGPAARRPEGFASAAGAPILTAPDGDTLAVTSGRGDLQVIDRDGSWARVRLEGWVWMPAAEEAAAASGATAAPAALAPADLTREPEAHIGRVVGWTLQFISLEEAEELRTDFRRGEPFLLTRYGGAEGPFVYVAVPPDQRTVAEGLVPLEMIAITARVRTGASALTGTPIVDLLSLERSP